jgi:IclR family transcriptional regulator, KDG regulon repressor
MGESMGAPALMPPAGRSPTSQTADRAIEVLFVLLRARRPLALGEISHDSGFPPATTHRLVRSLTRYNLVRQDPETSKYSLGLGLLEFSHAILNQLDVRELAAATLSELNELTRETIHLAILDGLELVYVDRRDTRHSIRINTSIGRRGTPHTTGVGKALLAFCPDEVVAAYLARAPLAAKTPNSITDAGRLHEELRRIRDRGFATDDAEDKPHVLCVAAPVFDVRGQPVAAISISSPDSRHSLESLMQFVPVLLEHTARISRTMGFH